MVRVGGMSYTIDPAKGIGARISDMRLVRTGAPIDPAKTYVVSGWASVNQGTQGPPVWDVVADYVRRKKTLTVPEGHLVKVV
jgi:sulfur-oxidizing protein SoxB